MPCTRCTRSGGSAASWSSGQRSSNTWSSGQGGHSGPRTATTGVYLVVFEDDDSEEEFPGDYAGKMAAQNAVSARGGSLTWRATTKAAVSEQAAASGESTPD